MLLKKRTAKTVRFFILLRVINPGPLVLTVLQTILKLKIMKKQTKIILTIVSVSLMAMCTYYFFG